MTLTSRPTPRDGQVSAMAVCFLMTFGTVELNTRRRRKADPESDEAGHGRGRRWEGVYSNHQEQYIYIYIQCIVIHIVYDLVI